MNSIAEPPKKTARNVAPKFDSPLPLQPISERFPALEEQEVVLTCFAPAASRVNVAGGFNDWSSEATPLKRTSAGEWAARLLLRAGQYEYRFIVDGHWTEDPRASQQVANPYGGLNSVLTVPLVIRASIL
jgi:1,4-alpha-glucan branching enzyme